MINSKANSISSYLIPSIADIIFVTVLFIIAFSKGLGLLNDGDTGYHIRAGEIILDTLRLPTTDPFSFISPPLTWTVHEWLAEVIMALLHRAGGLTLVVIFFGIVISTTYYIFLRKMKALSYGVLPSVAITILLFTLAQIHWLARPHTFSMLIMVYWYHLLNSFQYHNKDRLWILPLLMPLWVNIHGGGCIVGIVLVGLFMLGDCLDEYFSSGLVVTSRTKRYLLIIVCCILAALLNPFSYKIFIFPFKLVSDGYMMDHVQEFLSPNFHELTIFKYVLLAMIAILAVLRRNLTALDLLIVVFFTNMALVSVRYIPLFALFVLPVLFRDITLPDHHLLRKVSLFFARREETIASVDRRAKGVLWPVIASIAVLVLAYSGKISFAFDPKIKPVSAIEFINNNQISGNVFNCDEYGDILIYQTSGRYKVLIDGRLDMYGSGRLKEYQEVLSIKAGWQSIIARDGISWVFCPTDSVFIRHLATLSDWRLVYSDPVASILVQDIPVHKKLIANYQNVTLAAQLNE